MYSEIFGNMSGEDVAALSFVLVLYGVLFGVLFLGWLVNYILRGVGIYKMSKNRGIKNGFLGFIPYAHRYQFGVLAGELEIFNKKMKNTGLWLVLTPIIIGVVLMAYYFVFIISMIITLASNAVTLEYNPWPFLSGFFAHLGIFILLAMAAQLVQYLIFGLAYHKLYSHYSEGQRPVAYLLLTLFLPLGEGIVFFLHRNKSVIAPCVCVCEGEAVPPPTIEFVPEATE